MIRTMPLAALVVLTLVTAAKADPVGVDITAVITSIGDYDGFLPSSLSVGAAVTAKYTYDPDAPNSASLHGLNANIGLYNYTSAPYGIVVRVGESVFQTDPLQVAMDIAITNGDSGDADVWQLFSRQNRSGQDYQVHSITSELYDYSGSALDSIALQTTPPELGLLYGYLHIRFTPADDPCWRPASGFSAAITSISLAADPYDPLLIPEPASAILICLGLTLLKCRKSRSCKPR